MRSIVYEENGPASVLRLIEREPADPGSGEVRVRVVVSGVNPTDWKSREGSVRTVNGMSVPDQDGAGVIDAIGPDVTDFAVGDRVWVSMAAATDPMAGTAQDVIVLPVQRVHQLPDGVSFDVGASLGVPAITAHRALTMTEGWPDRLAPGSLAGATVLVAGGAGAVSHAAIQLARWAGATVIATVSSEEKGRLATAAGAQHIVNYREDGAAERIREIAPDGVDTIVDVAVTQNAELDAAVLKPAGTIAIYATNPGDRFVVDIRVFMTLNARMQFVLLYTIPTDALDAAVADITAALPAMPVGEEAGLPLHRFPLEETSKAHDAVEAGAVGKVLIDLAPGA